VLFTDARGIATGVAVASADGVAFASGLPDASRLVDAVQRAVDRDLGLRAARGGFNMVERPCGLTPREREVVESVVAGKRNKEIAVDLGIAEKTVKVHRGRAMQKMQARSVAELVRGWTSRNFPASPS
jgi:FixJ family two-component response regulator